MSLVAMKEFALSLHASNQTKSSHFYTEVSRNGL